MLIVNDPNCTTYILKQTLIFICFLCFNKLISQNYDISTIAVNNNNHSASSTKKLYLDNEGFLWYSTHNGVVKEMGGGNSQFFQYVAPKNKDIYTFDLLKSSKNKLWSLTGEGINIINLETGKSEWKTFKYPKTDITVNFTSIKEDKNGKIWLATDKNVIYSYNNDEFERIEIFKSDYNDERDIYYGHASEIKTILDDGTLILKQNNKWFHIKEKSSKLIFNDLTLFKPTDKTSTILINDDAFFSSKSSGSYAYNNIIYQYKYIKEIDKKIVQVPYENVQFISNQENQNFHKKINLIALDKTKFMVLKFDKLKNDNYILNNEDIFALKSNITNVIYDEAGYFLLHTEAGISKIRYNSVGFKKYLCCKNISCRGFSEDSKGNILVYTYSGIFKLDKETDVFKEIDNIKDAKTYKKVLAVSYNFYKENDNTYWFYGYHESLIKFNVNEGTFETYNFPANKVLITDAERISDSKLMLATSLGLYSFDLKTKAFKNESTLNEKINLDGINVVNLMLNKRKSTLWIATKDKDHALVKIDYATNIISSFGPEKKGMPLIPSEIKTIHEDYKGNLWLGTVSGLQKINPVNFIAKKFTIVEGLTNDNVSGILEDDNYLWISTFNGLIKLNKKTENIQTFYKEDGIPNNEFNRKSFLKASNGKLYFGGLDGIVSFDPKVISKNDRNHRLFLTQYHKYDDKSKSIKVFNNFNESISKFNIPYQQNYLTLKFAINDILNPEKNIYQYRLVELSKEWVSLGNYNMLQLQGLKAGKYTLEVRGFSSNGNQTNINKYTISVNQVFYKKGWFIVLSLLALFGFLMLRNKAKEARVVNKYKRRIKTLQLRYNAINAQKKPHYVYDTVANIQDVMVSKGQYEATKYFNAFSEFLSTEVNINGSERILIKDEIDYLKSYIKLENLKLDNRMEVKFEIDKAIETDKSTIPCMLFQPLIEDALINGIIPKKYDLKLNLKFKIEDNVLIGEIIDNGIPRAPDKKRKNKPQSFETSILEERIKLANSLLAKKIDYSIVDIKSEGEHIGTKAVLKVFLKKIIKNDETYSEAINEEA